MTDATEALYLYQEFLRREVVFRIEILPNIPELQEEYLASDSPELLKELEEKAK